MKTSLYRNHSAVITASLILLVVYMFVVLPAVARSNFIVGFGVEVVDNRYVVNRLFTDSPAELSGLELNDQVRRVDNEPIEKLYEQYTNNFSAYVDLISGWRYRPVLFEIERKGNLLEVSITPRLIDLAEGIQIFGRRIMFCLFLLSMTVIILVSRTKSRDALLFSTCFMFIALWLCAGTRYWPSFLAPFIPDFQINLFYVQKLVSDVALQLVCSCLLLISLVFPRKQAIIEKFPRLDIAVFLIPGFILGVVMGNSDGSILNRLQDVYSFRLKLNSVIVVCAVLLMIGNYRLCESAIHREQSS